MESDEANNKRGGWVQLFDFFLTTPFPACTINTTNFCGPKDVESLSQPHSSGLTSPYTAK
jgi:hypothetical protein